MRRRPGRRSKHYLDGLIRRRTPQQALPITLSRRRLYILPTRSGVLFGLILLVMLLGATNYSNSLAFALTFWLAGIALVSMHRAHRNLAGLQVARIRARAVFAGEPARFDIMFGNNAGCMRHALRITIRSRGQQQPVDIAAAGTVSVPFRRATSRRGILPCPALQIESRYPLGLFRVWSVIQPQAAALVYPRPAGRTQPPEAVADAASGVAAMRRGSGEFLAHRRYRAGDTPRHIDWKASARSPALVVREYASFRQPDRWFDYSSLNTLTVEERLSQLTLWVEQAASAGRAYGLRLPDIAIGPDSGDAHRHACLKALALF